MTVDMDGWPENRKLILRELERLGEDIRSVVKGIADIREGDLAELKTEIALLKLKSSLWGAVLGGASGILVTAGAVLIRLVQ